MNMQVW